MQKNKFYTDLNLINLPIFSTSKRIKRKSEKEIIEIRKNNKKTKLIITYPQKKLTFFDRKILASIEYIFTNHLSLAKIEKSFNNEYEKELEKVKQKHSIKSTDEIGESEKQLILFSAMENVQKEYKLYLTLKEINDLIFNKSYLHKEIKQSLIKLSQTIIYQTSHYFIDNSVLEIPGMQLLNVIISRHKNRDMLTITLNPFHMINIVQKKVTRADLRLLNSFRQPIAGRLSELLNKALYGSKTFNKSKVVYDYSYICDYLQIEKRKAESLILQQLKKPFNELIEKKIIINWLLVKNLFGYEVSFYHSHNFYEDYYNMLDKKTKIKINKGLAQIIKNESVYTEFKNKIEMYFEKTNFKTETELDQVKPFYSKYLYLTEYMK